MRWVGLFVLLIQLTSFANAQEIELTKKDYLILIVGNYVHGFKEFDTSVTTFDDVVSIGIYWDTSTQEVGRAEQLAKRIRIQISALLTGYEWAEDVSVIVNVYSEDRTARGY